MDMEPWCCGGVVPWAASGKSVCPSPSCMVLRMEDATLLLTWLCCAPDRIAACKGGGLVLNGDLSMQLVVSPALQALVREAGIPVELQYDRPFSDSLQAEWRRLDVPVRITLILGSG